MAKKQAEPVDKGNLDGEWSITLKVVTGARAMRSSRLHHGSGSAV